MRRGVELLVQIEITDDLNFASNREEFGNKRPAGNPSR